VQPVIVVVLTAKSLQRDVHSRLAKLFVESFKAATGVPKLVGFTQGSIAINNVNFCAVKDIMDT
jgi:hypothetical protein